MIRLSILAAVAVVVVLLVRYLQREELDVLAAAKSYGPVGLAFLIGAMVGGTVTYVTVNDVERTQGVVAFVDEEGDILCLAVDSAATDRGDYCGVVRGDFDLSTLESGQRLTVAATDLAGHQDQQSGRVFVSVRVSD